MKANLVPKEKTANELLNKSSIVDEINRMLNYMNIPSK